MKKQSIETIETQNFNFENKEFPEPFSLPDVYNEDSNVFEYNRYNYNQMIDIQEKNSTFFISGKTLNFMSRKIFKNISKSLKVKTSKESFKDFTESKECYKFHFENKLESIFIGFEKRSLIIVDNQSNIHSLIINDLMNNGLVNMASFKMTLNNFKITKIYHCSNNSNDYIVMTDDDAAYRVINSSVEKILKCDDLCVNHDQQCLYWIENQSILKNESIFKNKTIENSSLIYQNIISNNSQCCYFECINNLLFVIIRESSNSEEFDLIVLENGRIKVHKSLFIMECFAPDILKEKKPEFNVFFDKSYPLFIFSSNISPSIRVGEFNNNHEFVLIGIDESKLPVVPNNESDEQESIKSVFVITNCLLDINEGISHVYHQSLKNSNDEPASIFVPPRLCLIDTLGRVLLRGIEDFRIKSQSQNKSFLIGDSFPFVIINRSINPAFCIQSHQINGKLSDLEDRNVKSQDSKIHSNHSFDNSFNNASKLQLLDNSENPNNFSHNATYNSLSLNKNSKQFGDLQSSVNNKKQNDISSNPLPSKDSISLSVSNNANIDLNRSNNNNKSNENLINRIESHSKNEKMNYMEILINNNQNIIKNNELMVKNNEILMKNNSIIFSQPDFNRNQQLTDNMNQSIEDLNKIILGYNDSIEIKLIEISKLQSGIVLNPILLSHQPNNRNFTSDERFNSNHPSNDKVDNNKDFLIPNIRQSVGNFGINSNGNLKNTNTSDKPNNMFTNKTDQSTNLNEMFSRQMNLNMKSNDMFPKVNDQTIKLNDICSKLNDQRVKPNDSNYQSLNTSLKQIDTADKQYSINSNPLQNLSKKPETPPNNSNESINSKNTILKNSSKNDSNRVQKPEITQSSIKSNMNLDKIEVKENELKMKLLKSSGENMKQLIEQFATSEFDFSELNELENEISSLQIDTHLKDSSNTYNMLEQINIFCSNHLNHQFDSGPSPQNVIMRDEFEMIKSNTLKKIKLLNAYVNRMKDILNYLRKPDRITNNNDNNNQYSSSHSSKTTSKYCLSDPNIFFKKNVNSHTKMIKKIDVFKNEFDLIKPQPQITSNIKQITSQYIDNLSQSFQSKNKQNNDVYFNLLNQMDFTKSKIENLLIKNEFVDKKSQNNKTNKSQFKIQFDFDDDDSDTHETFCKDLFVDKLKNKLDSQNNNVVSFLEDTNLNKNNKGINGKSQPIVENINFTKNERILNGKNQSFVKDTNFSKNERMINGKSQINNNNNQDSSNFEMNINSFDKRNKDKETIEYTQNTMQRIERNDKVIQFDQSESSIKNDKSDRIIQVQAKQEDKNESINKILEKSKVLSAVDELEKNKHMFSRESKNQNNTSQTNKIIDKQDFFLNDSSFKNKDLKESELIQNLKNQQILDGGLSTSSNQLNNQITDRGLNNPSKSGNLPTIERGSNVSFKAINPPGIDDDLNKFLKPTDAILNEFQSKSNPKSLNNLIPKENSEGLKSTLSPVNERKEINENSGGIKSTKSPVNEIKEVNGDNKSLNNKNEKLGSEKSNDQISKNIMDSIVQSDNPQNERDQNLNDNKKVNNLKDLLSEAKKSSEIDLKSNNFINPLNLLAKNDPIKNVESSLLNPQNLLKNFVEDDSSKGHLNISFSDKINEQNISKSMTFGKQIIGDESDNNNNKTDVNNKLNENAVTVVHQNNIKSNNNDSENNRNNNNNHHKNQNNDNNNQNNNNQNNQTSESNNNSFDNKNKLDLLTNLNKNNQMINNPPTGSFNDSGFNKERQIKGSTTENTTQNAFVNMNKPNQLNLSNQTIPNPIQSQQNQFQNHLIPPTNKQNTFASSFSNAFDNKSNNSMNNQSMFKKDTNMSTNSQSFQLSNPFGAQKTPNLQNPPQLKFGFLENKSQESSGIINPNQPQNNNNFSMKFNSNFNVNPLQSMTNTQNGFLNQFNSNNPNLLSGSFNSNFNSSSNIFNNSISTNLISPNQSNPHFLNQTRKTKEY